MNTITIAPYTYTYTLVRQPRKSLQLELTGPLTLLIKAPLHLEREKIFHFIRQKAAWLEKKNQLLPRGNAARPGLDSGTTLPFRGQHLFLQKSSSRCKPAVSLYGNTLKVNLYEYAPQDDTHSLLLAWYRQQALTTLAQKTTSWSQRLDVNVKKITIKDQKTRWGSCSSLGNINYNWRIIMAPEPAIDYLVVHEVAHRIHLNHSAAFWQLVGQHIPDYSVQKRWLRQHGSHLFNIL